MDWLCALEYFKGLCSKSCWELALTVLSLTYLCDSGFSSLQSHNYLKHSVVVLNGGGDFATLFCSITVLIVAIV